MKIADVELVPDAEADVLSGTIDGFRLFYRVVPRGQAVLSAEPFVSTALLAAMARGEPLEVTENLSVSPRLLTRLETLQEIFSTWNRHLRRIPVIARPGPPPAPRSGVAAFFSGGVDSLYTFLEREGEITHLVHLHGFDYRRQNRALAEESERENRRFAEARGRRLVTVESNYRELFEQHGVHTNLYHGAVLGGIALVLDFPRTYVPASFAWNQLVPWGSHPCTDPLWGTESVEIVHHGLEARRLGKLRRLCGDAEALALLRVCPTNTVYSCGVCEKCLRTRVGLRLLGVTTPRLPPLVDLREVRRLRLVSAPYRLEWQQSLEAAVSAGDRPLARAIAASLARFDLRQAIRSFDRGYLGSGLRRTVHLSRRLLGSQAARPDPLGPEPPDVGRI